MQNFETQKYVRNMQLLLPDTPTRRLVLPFIIGLAIGEHLQAKQGNELNPYTVFADEHASRVSQVVSCLNEEMIIDVQAAQDAARAMYIMRHRILNGTPCDYASNNVPEFDFMAVALGLSSVVPLEVYEALKSTGLSACSAYLSTKIFIAKQREAGQLPL